MLPSLHRRAGVALATMALAAGVVGCTTEPVDPGNSITGNLAPVAVAAATPTGGAAPLDVAFDASGSYDSDGSIAFYEWNFGDGSPTSSEKKPSHTYTVAGSYIASLLVTDGVGGTGVDTVTIDVTP